MTSRRLRNNKEVFEGLLGLVFLALVAIFFAAYFISLMLPSFFLIGLIYYAFLKKDPLLSEKDVLIGLCEQLEVASNRYIEILSKYSGVRVKNDGTYDERSKKGKQGNIEKSIVNDELVVAQTQLEKLIKPHNSAIFYRSAAFWSGLLFIGAYGLVYFNQSIDSGHAAWLFPVAAVLAYLIAKLTLKSNSLSPKEVSLVLHEGYTPPPKTLNLIPLFFGIAAVLLSFKMLEIGYLTLEASKNSPIVHEIDTVNGRTSANVNLRSEPSTKGVVIETINEGTSVILNGKSEDGNWYRAVSVQGKDSQGYISSAYLFID